MQVVEQLIGELLLRHNCVIIPSFGGFVAQQTSATIDFRSGTMLPPKKSLLFNRQLINNDGLLIAELAVQNNMHYNEAQEVITTTVTDWNNQLAAGERVAIDKVGFLFFDQERNICFEQDRFYNLLLSSYGLGSIHFLPEDDVQLVQKKLVEHSNTTDEGSAILFDTDNVTTLEVHEEEKIIEHPAVAKNRKAWKYIAAACFLPIAFYTYWIPMRTQVLASGLVSFRDFNPAAKTTAPSYEKKTFNNIPTLGKSMSFEEVIATLPQDVAVYSLEFDPGLYLPVQLRTEEPVNVEPLQTPVKKEAANSSTTYHLIIGCFGDERNATTLVQTLQSKGFNASILDKNNGLSRVSAGSASSATEIEQLRSNVAQSGHTGWILKH